MKGFIIILPMAFALCMFAYVGMTAAICENVLEGVYDVQTQEAMELTAETCKLPWYKKL